MLPTQFIERIREKHKDFVGNGTVSLKQGIINTLNIDRNKRLVSGTISATVPDMDGEVVLAAGMDRSYFPKAVKAVYFNHNYDDMPVGACRNITVRGGGYSLFATTYILDNERGNDLLTAMESEAVNGFSIGFKATEYGPPSMEETMKYGDCHTIIRKGMLIEYSITPMPSCQAALVELVSKCMIHRTSAVAFGLQDSPNRKVFRARPIVVADEEDEVVVIRKTRATGN